MFRPMLQQLLVPIRRWENLGAVLLALTIGLAGGAGAILFRYLIQWADRLFFEGGRGVLPALGDGYVILLPIIGLVAVSAIVRRWAPEAQGHGVPEVMYAVKKRGGRIRPRVAVIKALASALCIGSGGSVGREGPIVQIGCTIGSTLGQLLGLRARRVRLLVACGAAAAVGGTFNAPIGGVIFAMEVILGNFAARSFGLVVLSSVTSTALCQAVLGNEPAFPLSRIFTLQSYYELPIYLVLGLVTGLIALGYTQTLYWLESVFERWRWHHLAKAALGGLAMGLVGYVGLRYFGGRYLFGVGYDGIERVLALPRQTELDWSLAGGMTVTVLLLMVVMKIIATSLTLAAGGSGGVFAPALFIGAMAGGAFGSVVNALFPGVTAPPGAYAIVGMAAVFAGSAHAPITSILILFEMTDDYQIILPLMMAVVISHLVTSSLKADSIYSIKLRRQGGLTPSKPEPSVLDLIVVADAMSLDFQTVGPDEPVTRLAAQFHGGHNRAACVLDEQERLVGIVTEFDVESALIAGGAESKCAGDIMTRSLLTCTPGQRLREVLATVTQQDVGQLPVVDEDDPSKVVGALRRREIFWAYSQLATEHSRLVNGSPMELPTEESDLVQQNLEVAANDDRLAFRKMRDIAFPTGCRVVVVRRADRTVVPAGDTVVEPGDVLILVTTRAAEPALRSWTNGNGSR